MTQEDIRHDVLNYLYARPAVAVSTDAIFRQLARDHRATPEAAGVLTLEAVSTALHFLHGLGHVTLSHDSLGSTRYWQITPSAILAKERGTL